MAEVAATPAGLIAGGGLVAAVLLALPPIVRAARANRLRAHPYASDPTATPRLSDR